VSQKKLSELSLEELLDRVGVVNSLASQAVQFELQRRQTKAQIASAKFLMWSVVVIAFSSAASAIFSFLQWQGCSP
jgi:hypothetical protein